MKLRTRVALAGGAVVVAALTLVGAVEYPAVDWELRGQLDASLAAMVKQAPTTFHEYQQKLLMAGKQVPDPLQGNGWSDTIGSGSIQIVTDPQPESGKESPDPKSASYGKPDDPKPRDGKELADLTLRDVDVASGATGPYYGDVLFQGERYRTYTAQMPGMANTIVRAAKPESDSASTMRRLLWLLIGLTPTAGLVAVVSARLLAGRVLRPVGVLTSAVERITETGDFTTPGPLRQAARGRDEVARLGRAFTAMTEALDGSVGAQRRLVADASHELRTPLTSLTTNLELLTENPADPASPALLADALEQARELKVLINDLVDLARFGEAAARAEPVRLDLVAEQVAEARGVPARTEPAVLRGDPDALERAVANLVDNAVKFSGMRGVTVTVVTRGHQGVLEVRDQGPGIPTADLPYIFDRFHRSSAARALPGSGLGLAIVKQIADAHGGRVEAVPVETGALLRLTLPLLIDVPQACDGQELSHQA
ncbi:MAG: HAMP domain-containing histidine kinase [Catenulispora sp.]|nr:HAMP domain-containing histidine kinase [Catenulispora sp.]